jgi:hypothetical protein
MTSDPARFRIAVSAALGVWALAPGCSGEVSDSRSGEREREEEASPAPPSRSLRRNPDAPLRCDNASARKVPATAFSRLTPSQYINTLRDLAAPVVLPPDLGAALPTGIVDGHGFDNNWRLQSIEDRAVEQYAAVSHEVATAMIADLKALQIAGCTPQASDMNAGCATSIIDELAPRAYRRPLDEDERERLRKVFDEASGSMGSDNALALLVEVILASPQVIYRIEVGEGGEDGNLLRLGGYELATRLSYLLAETTPDRELMEAAAAGELDTSKGVAAQAARLLAGPRASAALERFSSQWLRFAKLRITLPASQKDKTRFPDYDEKASDAITRGIYRFVEETLLGEDGSIEEMLRTPRAWVNDASAAIYDVEAPGTEELVAVDLDPSRRKGFLTQAGVMAGLAHASVHSPIQRGVFVFENLLCSPPAPPPPDISTDTAAKLDDSLSTRDKIVEIHQGQGAACKGCHARLDAVGFTFENYDGIGRWQDEEIVGNDSRVPVDASGALSGTFDADGKFTGAVQLIENLAASEQVKQCFVENFFRFGLARDLEEGDDCAIARATDAVVAADGNLRTLVDALVKSDSFRYRLQLER